MVAQRSCGIVLAVEHTGAQQGDELILAQSLDPIERLETEVKARGLTVFAHIDHAAGAAAVGMTLRPTDLLIFGNAKVGTPLMHQKQTIGIDLPLKALVWQDDAGVTWLSYNDPRYLAERHGAGEPADAQVNAMIATLHAIATKVTEP